MIVIQQLGAPRADTTTADENGHFRLTVQGNRNYQLSATDSLAEALGLQVKVTLHAVQDSTMRVVLTLPSQATTVRLICGRATSDPGAVAGRVISKYGDADPTGATVTVSWIATEVDAVARRVQSVSRVAITRPDRDGRFVVCGLPVPLRATLVMQVGQDSTAQDVTLSANAQLASVAFNLVPAAHTSAPSQRKIEPSVTTPLASASDKQRSVSVTVLSTSSQPIPRAQVTLDNAARFFTDSAGVVRLWPGSPGTHHLLVRKLGFAPLDVTSALSATGSGITVHLRSVIPELARVDVTAPQNRARSEFALRARTGIGDYFTEADIERLKPECLLDLLKRLPGVQVQKSVGCHGGVSVSRGAGTINGDQSANGCVHLVVDGGPASGYDTVPVDDILGVEFYDEVDAPIRFGNQCALIEVWTKEARSID